MWAKQWAGQDLVVVVPANMPRLWDIAGLYFDSFEPLDPVVIHRNGEPALTLELRRGRNLHFP